MFHGVGSHGLLDFWREFVSFEWGKTILVDAMVDRGLKTQSADLRVIREFAGASLGFKCLATDSQFQNKVRSAHKRRR